ARRGQVVVVSSIYAFANGMLNTPYAVAKAGVEQLGRALRVELSIHGASATVAYFGFVDTVMVRQAFEQSRQRSGREPDEVPPSPRRRRARRSPPLRRRRPRAGSLPSAARDAQAPETTRGARRLFRARGRGGRLRQRRARKLGGVDGRQPDHHSGVQSLDVRG